MKKSEKYNAAKWILILVLVLIILLVIDQVTKLIAENYLGPEENHVRIDLIANDWLYFTYSLNPAVAFSFGAGNEAFMLAIKILTPILAALFIVLALTLFRKNKPVQTCLFIISSGAIGNFIDRMTITNHEGVASVRDFFGLKFFNICNFADFCVTLGAVALIICVLFIGPHAAFPLKKQWREQAKREEEEKKRKKHGNA